MKPRRRICDQTDTPPAASAAELVPNLLGFLSFGAYQQRREGDPDAWATQFLHIICPGLHPGEGTPASSHCIDTTRKAAVTGYKPYCLTGVEQGTRAAFDSGEILKCQWTATTCLKLGSLQSDRCCPATIRLPYWVHGAYGQHQTSKCNHCTKQNKRKTQSSSTQAGHLECKDHDTWPIRYSAASYDARKTAVIREASKAPTSDICRVIQPNQCICANLNLCIRIEG